MLFMPLFFFLPCESFKFVGNKNNQSLPLRFLDLLLMFLKLKLRRIPIFRENSDGVIAYINK